MPLVTCPVCGRAEVQQILQQVRLSAQLPAREATFGVIAYLCVPNGHIFFVRHSDVGLEAAAGA